MSTNQLSFTESFVLSGLTAALKKTAFAPIEGAQLIDQTAPELKRLYAYTAGGGGSTSLQAVAPEGSYNPYIDSPYAWQMTTSAGLKATGLSLAINCARHFPTQLLNFTFPPVFRSFKIFRKTVGDSKVVRFTKNFVAEGLASSATLFFVYGLQVAQQSMALGLPFAASDLFRHLNHPAYQSLFFSDFFLSCAGMVVYRGVSFGGKTIVMPLLGPKPSFVKRFVAGYGVTVAAGLLTYPIGCVRTRMMLAACTSAPASLAYTSAWQCTAAIVESEGIAALWAGASTSILKGVLGGLVLSYFDVRKLYIQHVYGSGGSGFGHGVENNKVVIGVAVGAAIGVAVGAINQSTNMLK